VLTLIQIIYIMINVMIGLYDFSFYRIPNALLGALLALYVVYAPFYLGLEEILYSIAICLGVLAITFVLFATKVIGGGDAKFLTVSSLWVGTLGIIPFALIFSVLGAILGIIYLVFKDHVQRLSDWVWLKIQNLEKNYTGLQYVWSGSGSGPELGVRENIGAKMLPYGIAIALAAIILMVNNPITGI